jgi:hypothetical protein
VSERRSQSARILTLLESKPEVSSRELSAISLQYCARIAELRDAGEERGAPWFLQTGLSPADYRKGKQP